jgi:uncharacterized protein (TIGR03067 family)
MPDELQGQSAGLPPNRLPPANNGKRDVQKPRTQQPAGWQLPVILLVVTGLLAYFAYNRLFAPQGDTNAWVGSALVPTLPQRKAPGPTVSIENELRALIGSWTATSLVVGGENATEDDVAQVKLTLDFQGFKLALPRKTWQGEWGINVNTFPKQLTFSANGEPTILAIYATEGDVLKVCLTISPGERPGDFTAQKGSPNILLVLKRPDKR